MARTFKRLFHHQEEHRDRKLSQVQRVRVAARLAAATLFSRRPIIAGFDHDEPTDPSITARLEDVCGRITQSDGTPFDIQREQLEETVDTGPFTAGLKTGEHYWSSRVHEELLAAQYVADYAFDVRVVDSLFRNELDSEESIVPTLRGAFGLVGRLPTRSLAGAGYSGSAGAVGLRPRRAN